MIFHCKIVSSKHKLLCLRVYPDCKRIMIVFYAKIIILKRKLHLCSRKCQLICPFSYYMHDFFILNMCGLAETGASGFGAISGYINPCLYICLYSFSIKFMSGKSQGNYFWIFCRNPVRYKQVKLNG